jgi:hypothetical protein
MMISAKQRAQVIQIAGSSNFSSMSSTSSSCSSESEPVTNVENSSSANVIIASNSGTNANSCVNVNTPCTINPNLNQLTAEQTSTKASNASTSSNNTANNNNNNNHSSMKKNYNNWNGNKCKLNESKPELINEVYDYWKNFDIKRLQVRII